MGEKKITKVTVLPSISDYDDGLRRSKRVAAYCRVSTLAEEQETSLIAQQDYYYKYIRSQDNWELINIYYDDGISGLSFHNRDGFNDMIDDALSGKIDLILTKSLSRFARNTVDTLVIIRKLKEKGVEVYFEKENIWTMDSKGEFLITLMSSLAQEESRSMSENVTWGLRKCFSDGKYHVPYAHFLGYSRGGVHTMVVNPDEEATVRLIFLMSIMGLTNAYIAKFLQSNNIPTPGNGVRWRDSTIRSILDNEKYCGNALLQKTFTTDFLSKSRKVNEGEVPQYFIENGHEAIISGDVADLTAAEKDRRRSFGKTYSCIKPLTSFVKCGICGGLYYPKISKLNDIETTYYWQCKNSLNGPKHAPSIRDDAFLYAYSNAIDALRDENPDVRDTCCRIIEHTLESSAEPVITAFCQYWHQEETFVDRIFATGITCEINISNGTSCTFYFRNGFSHTELAIIPTRTRMPKKSTTNKQPTKRETNAITSKEVQPMTAEMKKTIVHLRNCGWGYKRIAKELGASLDAVKSYCKRNGLGGYAVDRKEKLCAYCYKPIYASSPSGRPRKYCSDTCRVRHWYILQAQKSREVQK